MYTGDEYEGRPIGHIGRHRPVIRHKRLKTAWTVTLALITTVLTITGLWYVISLLIGLM